MKLAQVESAEQRMQQQWHDLVRAEQEGQPLEVLEQMYDRYILLVEEFNACAEAYQRARKGKRAGASARRSGNLTSGPAMPRQGKQQDAKLAS
jgi:hypothetical protein